MLKSDRKRAARGESSAVYKRKSWPTNQNSRRHKARAILGLVQVSDLFALFPPI